MLLVWAVTFSLECMEAISFHFSFRRGQILFIGMKHARLWLVTSLLVTSI